MRLKLAVIVMGLFAVIAVTGASAADFEKDFGSGADCHVPTGGGPNWFGVRRPTSVGSTKSRWSPSQGLGCTTLDGKTCTPGTRVVNGGLPPGLSMTRAGVISGTPISTGFFPLLGVESRCDVCLRAGLTGAGNEDLAPRSK